jgi:hypothetical protein
MEDLQAAQPRGGALRMRDKHGGNTTTASTVRRMVCEIFECGQGLSELFDASKIVTTSLHIGTL